jgi:Spy/CpxP family protein refolding chaperone
MIRNFRQVAVAAGLACVLTSGVALAKSGHHRHPHEALAGFGPPQVMRLVHRLALEGTQREQVFAIADRYQPTLRKLAFSLHDGRSALRGILQDGAYDAARVERDAAAQAQATQALYETTAKMLSEVSAVLTPEQRAQLATAGAAHHPSHGR